MNPSNASVISGDGKFVAAINQPEIIQEKISSTTMQIGNTINSNDSTFLNDTQLQQMLKSEVRDDNEDGYTPPPTM